MQRNSDTIVDKLGHLLRSFTAPLMYLCRDVTLRYCMDVTVPFDPGAAGLVLVQASPELTSNMSFPFYKPVWTSTESLCLHSLYLYSAISIFYSSLSESSQSISIYDRGIGAKNSVSISISRFLRLENLLYIVRFCLQHTVPPLPVRRDGGAQPRGRASQHRSPRLRQATSPWDGAAPGP